MLNPRLTNCIDCASISILLSDIECKITKLAKDEYNNTVFLLNRDIDKSLFSDLLNYKRILSYRVVNPDYVCNITMDRISSKVKILINK